MISPLLEVKHLSKHFYSKGQMIRAIHDVSFSLFAGQILGIGGESGCGKSTLAKLIMGLIEPTAGSIVFNGQEITQQSHHSKAWRRQMQMVFQQPASSLNPRMSVQDILAEPLKIHGLYKELAATIPTLLAHVGLSEEYLYRFSHELSGGQKQRIAIARALALEPQILICDEPFSALDVSIQAQIMNLLVHLHHERKLAYLIISHDLSILQYLSHQMAIMYSGQLMEWGPSSQLYQYPLHPYSQLLVASVLSADPIKERQRPYLFIKEDNHTAHLATQGCPFYARCPHAMKVCQSTKPIWREVKPQHFTACHLYDKA